jgi:NADPH:quinone reductase-like Zn-dependent oxidoreductase
MVEAIIQDRYGPIDVLERRSIPTPTVGEAEILVRVRAAALHIGDVFAVTGSPFPVRLATGLRRPRHGVPGYDLAGEVEAVGGSVTRFRPGDRVFGVGNGTAAELTRTNEASLVPMPDGLSFEEAAAIPTSGHAALVGLRKAGRLQPGQRVLVNGASGGVGTFAVQIAKAMGAHVTGVTSARNVELVRSLGADRVIDYTSEDFSETGPYDLILDCIENRTLADVRRALAPRGTLVLNSGTGATGLAMLVRLVKPLLISPFVGHRLTRFVSNPNHDDLMELRAWTEAGTVRPVIDRTYALAETSEALRYIAAGHARGKVVVRVGG